MDLREYERNKFAIADILRSASAYLPQEADELRTRLADLFARLAEDRFNLVVVGRFNRGKTSLMNAILGTDRLPTGIVPLTSVITTVGYGSRERGLLKYESRILDKEIPIETLPQYITQRGNPGNIQQIKTAEIQLPAEILRRGFYFVDTPGVGSVIAENTLTTEAFLPEADALILVTSFESPLSEEELRFLKAASMSRQRIFIVLNKHDTVSLEQRDIALSFVREQLTKLCHQVVPPIFSVSSTDGLKAKLSHDRALLDASGISELEKQLLSFLLAEKNIRLLTRMCDRTREFLHGLSDAPEIRLLIGRIDDLAQQFDRQYHSVSTSSPATTSLFPDLHQLHSCEICTHVNESLWNFVSKYQYEIIVRLDAQQRLADRGGFCPFHAWQYQSVASPHGICAGLAPLLDRLAVALRGLSSMAHPKQIHARIGSLLPNEDDCALCCVRAGAERDAIESAATRLRQNRQRALDALSAICLPHFVILASAIEDSDLLRRMLKRQAAILERFSEDMKRYAIKHEAVRRYLASQEETAAAGRGLLALVGRQKVNFMPRRTSEARLSKESSGGANLKIFGKE